MDRLLPFGTEVNAGIEDVIMHVIDYARRFDCVRGAKMVVKDIIIARCVCA